jgi:hypothetical protein
MRSLLFTDELYRDMIFYLGADDKDLSILLLPFSLIFEISFSLFSSKLLGVIFFLGNVYNLFMLLLRRSDLDRFTELNILSSRFIDLSRYLAPINERRFVSTQLPIFIYNSY